MRTDIPQAIQRQEYSPPTYLVDTVELGFDLDPAQTRVSMRLVVFRHGQAKNNTLILHGEYLTLVQLRVDGIPLSPSSYRLTPEILEIPNLPDRATLEIETLTQPDRNTSLSGLYVSNGNFFTQCEAEGFRRIAYFPDRPDVMAKFTVMLRADKRLYPVLLSNGNLIEEGDLGDDRHFAKWEDPFKKPSYLFALVAGQLVCQQEWITQRSGHRALLQIWVEAGNLDKTQHAMASLKNSIVWDAERFGLELDLGRFMIVAVSDFNMGAMENKGLNIFNTKFVLANSRVATDMDYANIESVVGHEYFHNWTGNRVTCRDWFQLSLKEGLTVFRDQEFSADMIGSASGRAVKRIEDVRLLRQAQFPEDAGPMAHPIRPDSYVEINNFYTVTVYEKGAEVVRMYQTLFGVEGFRKGMDLYFARHDGQAVTCDDFRAAMADANVKDLSQFERWYSQAGTPRVAATAHYDPDSRHYTLTLIQSCKSSVGQPHKLPFHIPLAIGLLDQEGNDIPLVIENADLKNADLKNADLKNADLKNADAVAKGAPTSIVVALTNERQTVRFKHVSSRPVPSLLRNFSAPVILEFDYTDEELAFLLAHDSDAFNRWEAGQRLAMRRLLFLIEQNSQAYSVQNSSRLIDVVEKEAALLIKSLRELLLNENLDPAFREVCLTLPSESLISEQLDIVYPQAVNAARLALHIALARTLQESWFAIYEVCRPTGAYSPDASSVGKRALKNLALSYLADLDDERVHRLMQEQYERADNMTDRLAALTMLINSTAPFRDTALSHFYSEFESDALVIDKWFTLQAMARKIDVDKVCHLMRHKAFSIKNPNRARSLIFSFCNGNPARFHAIDGSGYQFWSEQVIALDAINPQVSARLARSLDRWRKYDPVLQKQMRNALQTVAASTHLSNDVLEVVTKALAD